ncbi:DUF222 domain-containing protein [Herbiconiux sp. P17]|uniref:HNH endonuclease signature motif containing protein n=1 Tax=Herbiconiux wuyangfengii TaxID=3342794 RepID=UPI0035BA4F1F
MNESGMRIDAILDELVAEEAIRAASSARTALLLAEATTLRLAESRSGARGLAMRSLTADISCATRLPEGTVIRLLNDAEILVNTLPATLEALSAGTINYRHAQVMAADAGTLPREARGAFEEALLPVAASTTAARFERTTRSERERLHPESIETRARAATADRDVVLTPDADGMAWLTCHLPAVAAVAIDTRLTRIARAAHTAAESRTHTQLRADALTTLLLGRRAAPPAVAASPGAPALSARIATPGQDADARPGPQPLDRAQPDNPQSVHAEVVQVPDDHASITHPPADAAPATHATTGAARTSYATTDAAPATHATTGAEPPDHPRTHELPGDAQPADTASFAVEDGRFAIGEEFLGVVPTVVVTVPALSLLGHDGGVADLHGFGPIDIDTARRLAARAPSFVRILTHPETGETLSVGRTRYRPPPDLRLALLLDDETCRFPNCNRRAESCELDHTTGWARGGETERANLHHLCPKHHHLKHDSSGWGVTARPGRTLEWRSPTGRKYSTTPRKGGQNPARPTFAPAAEAQEVVA